MDERLNFAGGMVRAWREVRRLSQMDLALEAEISQKHLSFIESGRSAPSREMLVHIAEHLDVPLRERNAMLLAAGFAPAYPTRSLEDRRWRSRKRPLNACLKHTSRSPRSPLIVTGTLWGHRR